MERSQSLQKARCWRRSSTPYSDKQRSSSAVSYRLRGCCQPGRQFLRTNFFTRPISIAIAAGYDGILGTSLPATGLGRACPVSPAKRDLVFIRAWLGNNQTLIYYLWLLAHAQSAQIRPNFRDFG